MVYRVTHKEKADTEKEETIGYFQNPPTEPQNASKFTNNPLPTLVKRKYRYPY
ncbi:hypothetical protein [Candidatus Williamhamiltonella defendens]|uniref:hypothetical protein n=1 Tax=Candidatus Williamhamiltonella defendens TaxID=138072 RepID=UPI001650E57A|nr:hypothetical protein [Candidatus Hamiltonella defensa]